MTSSSSTLGGHLARRLVQIGVTDVFAVPGDSNLTLLDYIVAEPSLNLIGCCSELNAGYAADGYARARGVGACIVTFTVGGLSILNAIAGAYSESLPVICIVGGPNSTDYGGTTDKILHHTIGCPDFEQELRCFEPVTACQVVVKHLGDAHEKIDVAICTALRESKPVYISICCNLCTSVHPTFVKGQVPFFMPPKMSDQLGLEVAVEAAAALLNKAVKPVMVGGPKLRVGKACGAFVELADVSGYALSVMPSAKGLVPEHHPNFMGTYWGSLSTPLCAEIVESADAYLFAGPIFDDISSVGFSLHVKKDKAVIVQPDRVVIGNGPSIGSVQMGEFFKALAKRLTRNTTSHLNYLRLQDVPQTGIVNGHLKLHDSTTKVPLKVNTLFKNILGMLSCDTTVIAEAGDSWFNCQKLKLPENCKYECQMLYGSIGWSIGATLGYAQAARDSSRVITCIGDGSFQITGHDISTMLRCDQNNVIFLINNGGYTTEAEIHEGPYTVIKNWNYTGIVDAIHNGEGKCWTVKVSTEEELAVAIEAATGEMKDCLCFIEAILHKDDCSVELLGLGARLAAANSRPPP